MAKSLVMVFTTEQGKKVNYNLSDIRDNLTKDDVAAVMNTILTKNIFTTTSGDLKAIQSASITDKNVTDLVVK